MRICEVSENENAPSACLFPENPHRLVSLWEIVRHFMAWQLAAALQQIHSFECEAMIRCTHMQGDHEVPAEDRGRIRKFSDYWKQQCQTLELQAAQERIDGPIRISLHAGLTYNGLKFEMRALREIIESELTYRRFAFVPVAKAAVLDNIPHEWGSVWDKLPNSETDTRSAVECYALDQNSACVFHLVRVAEHGLRALAKKLNVKRKDKGRRQSVEFAEWDKVITNVANRIAKARGKPHGPKRAAQLQFYSDAADHCLYMKELRNEVSHTRKTYNSGEALGTLQRVHGFMTFLAGGLAA